jgi:hypothetical protein
LIPSNLPTTWNPPTGPARWARSIVTLVDYLRPRYPTLTFLGGIGDQTHVAEGNTSAHNPLTRAPDGSNLVLAVDLGVTDGNYAPLLEIRDLIYKHPSDPRMAGGVNPKGNGYLSGPDALACNWPFGTGWNGGNADAGHLHVNVAAAYWPFTPGGYLDSMDLTTPWDFMTATAPKQGDGDMAWFKLVQCSNDPTRKLLGIYAVGPGVCAHVAYPWMVPFLLALPECGNDLGLDGKTKVVADVGGQVWDSYQLIGGGSLVGDTYTIVSSLPTRVASVQASLAQLLTAAPAPGGSVDPGIVAQIVAALPAAPAVPTATEIATVVAQVLGSKLAS